MNTEQRFGRLAKMLTEDRIVRRQWGDGYHKACLLVALAPEVGPSGVIQLCPASLMPEWMAHLTVKIDDLGTKEAWPWMIRRYSLSVRKGALTLDDEGWNRVRARLMIEALHVAENHDNTLRCVLAAAFLGRYLDGETPSQEQWDLIPNVTAMDMPATPLYYAKCTANAAKCALPIMAVEMAAEAEREAALPEKVQHANQAAWDRMTISLFDAIDTECTLNLAR
jgi:hypothetical protein